MQVGKFTGAESALFQSLEARKEPIQAELDALDAEVQEATKVVDAIKDRIRAVRPQLAPLAEMQAGLASVGSLGRYFPGYSKDQFIEYVESQLA